MISFNKTILHKDIQRFIDENLNTNISELVLKGIPFPKDIQQDILHQIESKSRSRKKLPTWFSTKNIYYPPKLNIEQTSSETTAEYKSNLIFGQSLIDLTGGFGVDTYYFSKHFKQVIHCELNQDLSKIVRHNALVLNTQNLTFYSENGLEVLKKLNQTFDWIYIDPSRRNDSKGKVFLLKDCLPNVPNHIDLLLNYSKNIMIKTSPLLDISSGINELSNVKTIQCIAVNNEVKELLWILEANYKGQISINTVDIKNDEYKEFNFIYEKEKATEVDYSLPLTYLYEPNSAILKSGAFNTLSKQLDVLKIHKHSHLYTSRELVKFPGRRFKIETVLPYNKKSYHKIIGLNQANVTTRHFPETVAQIRNKLKIKEGGKNYLFFTTNLDNLKIIIFCTKI
ncbi:class I SAM-dependent methyltransferase [Olleya sp. YS]|uniref:class I SAM-dependent methyltransferase n=1 Tax=Olleya sp. YS TaxID=3028318 RepID=UPI00243463A9|nr:class I SAM-dependent methyltransferase [Olleya sp. YS]WGD34454.1 class I SAM-dependent methyltransferase [Olleya sp. YS]